MAGMKINIALSDVEKALLQATRERNMDLIKVADHHRSEAYKLEEKAKSIDHQAVLRWNTALDLVARAHELEEFPPGGEVLEEGGEVSFSWEPKEEPCPVEQLPGIPYALPDEDAILDALLEDDPPVMKPAARGRAPGFLDEPF